MLSFLLDVTAVLWQSTHTPVVGEVAGPRNVCQAVLAAIYPSGVLQQQLFESSSIITGHYYVPGTGIITYLVPGTK